MSALLMTIALQKESVAGYVPSSVSRRYRDAVEGLAELEASVMPFGCSPSPLLSNTSRAAAVPAKPNKLLSSIPMIAACKSGAAQDELSVNFECERRQCKLSKILLHGRNAVGMHMHALLEDSDTLACNAKFSPCMHLIATVSARSLQTMLWFLYALCVLRHNTVVCLLSSHGCCRHDAAGSS